jgi:hypothetical protein
MGVTADLEYPRLQVTLLHNDFTQAVAQKVTVWFDTRMGADGPVQSADGEYGPLDAGCLMANPR